MTTFLFLRHAHSQANEKGVLAGRIAGVSLSKKGQKQSQYVLKNLSDVKIDRIITSPIDRCIETVKPLAQMTKRRIHLDESFVEMDYGIWSGASLKDLAKKAEWKEIQKTPESFIFPRGEGFAQASKRIEKGLNQLAGLYPDKTLLIVSHGDVIKLAAAITLGMQINDFQRIIVDPASVTVVVWEKKQRHLLHLNQNVGNRSIGLTLPNRAKIGQRKTLGGGGGE